MMSLCALLLALFVGSADVHVTLKLKDGRTVTGTTALMPLEIDMAVGVRTIDPAAIQQITLGDPDAIIETNGRASMGTLDLPFIQIRTEDGEAGFVRHAIESVRVNGRPCAEPEVIVNGTAANGMTYHVRVPDGYKHDRAMPAIVIFHGSNMNSRSYVRTIISAWPELANRYILIGINGERKVPDRPAHDPAYNYTYVNFVGKSTYQGYPGTDRESPALVAEVLEELRAMFPLDRVFVGGHSQGGFLTYSMLMNYPDLIDGAFPISGGLIMQCEPAAYDRPELCAQQRRRPLAIVHGEKDGIVSPMMAQAAFESFEDAGFAEVRSFSDPRIGHQFALLPVNDAVAWLDAMTSGQPATLIRLARDRIEAGAEREASAALARARDLDNEDAYGHAIAPLERSIAAARTAAAEELMPRVEQDEPTTWVSDVLAYRARFGHDDTDPILVAFDALRTAQQDEADALMKQAWQAADSATRQDLLRQIVERCPASSWYRTAQRALR